MKNIYLIALFIASSAFADHNSHLEGYDPDRGYNRSNCLSLQSKTTNKQAEWLGHHVGCMVEDGNGYVLIMEYKVQEISKDMGDDLRDLVEEYTNRIEM